MTSRAQSRLWTFTCIPTVYSSRSLFHKELPVACLPSQHPGPEHSQSLPRGSPSYGKAKPMGVCTGHVPTTHRSLGRAGLVLALPSLLFLLRKEVWVATGVRMDPWLGTGGGCLCTVELGGPRARASHSTFLGGEHRAAGPASLDGVKWGGGREVPHLWTSVPGSPLAPGFPFCNPLQHASQEGKSHFSPSSVSFYGSMFLTSWLVARAAPDQRLLGLQSPALVSCNKLGDIAAAL